MSETTETRTIKIVAEMLGHEPETTTLERKLVEDLGADSLDKVECIMALEDEFNIEISDEDAEKWITIADVVEYLTPLVEA